MVSNIAPVTSLPWLELSKVKVRTSAVRIDHDSVARPRTEGNTWLLAGHGGHGIQGMQACEMAWKLPV